MIGVDQINFHKTFEYVNKIQISSNDITELKVYYPENIIDGISSAEHHYKIGNGCILKSYLLTGHTDELKCPNYAKSMAIIMDISYNSVLRSSMINVKFVDDKEVNDDLDEILDKELSEIDNGYKTELFNCIQSNKIHGINDVPDCIKEGYNLVVQILNGGI